MMSLLYRKSLAEMGNAPISSYLDSSWDYKWEENSFEVTEQGLSFSATRQFTQEDFSRDWYLKVDRPVTIGLKDMYYEIDADSGPMMLTLDSGYMSPA